MTKTWNSKDLSKPPTEFVPWPKIARFNRNVIVTEKLDGTNACVHISDDGTSVHAASRTRWITPADDNYGFAAWVASNAEDLLRLGPGSHFGEWWGRGVQHGYGLSDRRFSLFNTTRWGVDRPACCGVVPVLWTGPMEALDVGGIMTRLIDGGSVAAPGCKNPEGIVIFHEATGAMFKKTIKNDGMPKGLVVP